MTVNDLGKHPSNVQYVFTKEYIIELVMCGHFLLSACLCRVSWVFVDRNLCGWWDAARTEWKNQAFLIFTSVNQAPFNPRPKKKKKKKERIITEQVTLDKLHLYQDGHT